MCSMKSGKEVEYSGGKQRIISKGSEGSSQHFFRTWESRQTSSVLPHVHSHVHSHSYPGASCKGLSMPGTEFTTHPLNIL